MNPDDVEDVAMQVLEEALRRPDRDEAAARAASDRAIERAAAEGLVDVGWTIADTPIGPLTLAATEVGLVRVGFGHEEQMIEDLARVVSPRVVRLPARLDQVRRQLDEYFAGEREVFAIDLDWRLTHGFRRTVLERLVAEVPFGHTVSYAELALVSGRPRASRAVGTAMATNPLPIVVPCHRVLRTGGALGGYGGGLDTKRHLLSLERGSLL
jgi:methylated-DNA-[protein]-cysteine S-methyltransferase